MPVDTAPELRSGVAKEELTGLAGLALTAGLVKYLGWRKTWSAGCASRHLGRSVGPLVRSGRRQRLLFGRGS